MIILRATGPAFPSGEIWAIASSTSTVKKDAIMPTGLATLLALSKRPMTALRPWIPKPSQFRASSHSTIFALMCRLSWSRAARLRESRGRRREHSGKEAISLQSMAAIGDFPLMSDSGPTIQASSLDFLVGHDRKNTSNVLHIIQPTI